MKRLQTAVKTLLASTALAGVIAGTSASADDALKSDVAKDYDAHLSELFRWFHQKAELSFMENETAARLASELRDAGFDVTEGVAGTGVVAIMKNGPGPLVMMRADMDGLPVKELTDLPYASRNQQKDPIGRNVFVMHACGHDVHITSLVGTARAMAARKDQWSGTLMLVGQPAEERIGGAKKMVEAGMYDTFGLPDHAMAFHVAAAVPTGKLVAVEGSAYSGADTVDIVIHGVGAHGASPHAGIDPIVLGSQIVMGLQTVVSRTLPPREAGVITVGSFHSGFKHNIISDLAKLEITVRNDNMETRQILLDGIERVATNMGRVAGLPEDKLPEVTVNMEESVPPTVNDIPMTKRLRKVWAEELGDDIFYEGKRLGMGAEDFPYFVTDPYIPSTYFAVGGTPQAAFDAADAGGPPVASHHSPLFKIDPDAAVPLGVEATVLGLINLLQDGD